MNDNNDPTGGNGEVAANEEHHLPAPLLKNVTATIYFDGLIYTAFDKLRRLYQAAVLTQAEGHELNVKVNLEGEQEPLFPTDELPWNPSHEVIKGLAPFWLYVDSGNNVNAEEFSSELYLPAGDDEHSFDRLFNFDKKHGRKLAPKPQTFAEFNFPHGTCYSADNDPAKLKVRSDKNGVTTTTPGDPISVSTLGAVDIDAVSNGETKKYIVLSSQAGQEFFRFELEPGKHYQIQLLNQPVANLGGPTPAPHPHHEGHGEHGEHGDLNDHEKHFLQFYELFDLKPGEKKFIVDLTPDVVVEAGPFSLPHSPPCVGTSGDLDKGLGG